MGSPPPPTEWAELVEGLFAPPPPVDVVEALRELFGNVMRLRDVMSPAPPVVWWMVMLKS